MARCSTRPRPNEAQAWHLQQLQHATPEPKHVTITATQKMAVPFWPRESMCVIVATTRLIST